MKNYIKPEAEVYKVGIVSPLCGSVVKPDESEDGQREDRQGSTTACSRRKDCG